MGVGQSGFLKLEKDAEWYRVVQRGWGRIFKAREGCRVVQRSWWRILKAREVYNLKQDTPSATTTIAIERIKPYREVP